MRCNSLPSQSHACGTSGYSSLDSASVINLIGHSSRPLPLLSYLLTTFDNAKGLPSPSSPFFSSTTLDITSSKMSLLFFFCFFFGWASPPSGAGRINSSRRVEKFPLSSESEELVSDFSSFVSVFTGISESQLTIDEPVLPFSDFTGEEPLEAFSSLTSSFLIFC